MSEGTLLATPEAATLTPPLGYVLQAPVSPMQVDGSEALSPVKAALVEALPIQIAIAEIPVPTFRERRASRRFTCEGKAEVIVLGGALRFQGQVRDLSATGCCMTTDVVFTLERGTQVEIVMMVNHVQFRVLGGVRSNHKVRGVGLEFMNVSARCARFIKDLIAELEVKQAAELKAADSRAG